MDIGVRNNDSVKTDNVKMDPSEIWKRRKFIVTKIDTAPRKHEDYQEKVSFLTQVEWIKKNVKYNTKFF